MHIMPFLEGVDVVLTDPPFDEKTHQGAHKDSININFNPLGSIPLLVEALLEVSSKWVLCFCSFEMLGGYSEAAGNSWIRSGVWDKIINMPQITGDRPAQGGEAIAIMHPTGRKVWFGGGKAAIWRHMVERGKKQHPTQKPLRLMQELMHLFTKQDDVILDPFMGSASTLVACAKMGRKGIGIELDEDYFNIACKRVEEAYKQPDMFVEQPKAISKQEDLLT